MPVLGQPGGPSLEGATQWLNGEPLGADALRGRVVLVDFWTLTCINWLRTLPYIRAWDSAYRTDGLVVVGVHSPEFSFERDVNLVQQAVEAFGIDFPVAVDSDYQIWRAFRNQYWPALYFIDREGVVRGHHFGEGAYEASERLLQRLLDVKGAGVAVDARGIEVDADWEELLTPETYLGYARREKFVSLNGAHDRRSTYVIPPQLLLTTGRSTENGRSSRSEPFSTRLTGRSPFASMRATPTWSCPEALRRPSRSVSSWTEQSRGRITASTSMRRATAYSRRGACISSYVSGTRSRTELLRSSSVNPGLRPTRSRSDDPSASARPCVHWAEALVAR